LVDKKDLIIIILAGFMLIVTLYPRITATTVEYDPWIDINDDGAINVKDIFAVAKAFGSEGTPINKTALLLDLLDRVDGIEESNSNLFNDPTWTRTLYLPLGNWSKVGITLIGLGGWHPDWVSHPRVIYNKADGKYSVYFAGGNTSRSIGLAIGTSLKSALTEITDGINGTSRVLDASGVNGTFDEKGVSFPSVIYDPLELNSSKRWKMLFNGRTAADEYHDIGYAYSADGKSWTKYPRNPVIDQTWDCTSSALMRLGNIYYCIYRRVNTNSLRLAYSGDMVTWTEWGNILSVGDPGAWDDYRIQYPTIYFDGGTMYLFYSGNQAGGNIKMGLALSNTFFGTWQKLPYNPVLQEMNADACSGCIIRMEDEFIMVYESNNPTRAIRSATIP
jgi:hypothetical protein